MNKNEFKRFILHTIKENFASQEFHFEEREKAMEYLENTSGWVTILLDPTYNTIRIFQDVSGLDPERDNITEEEIENYMELSVDEVHELLLNNMTPILSPANIDEGSNLSFTNRRGANAKPANFRKKNKKQVKEFIEKNYDTIKNIFEGAKINEDVMADKNYTHFAIHKPTGKIINAWNYKGIDSDELKLAKDEYFFNDLRDDFDIAKKGDVKIITRKALDKIGLNPESIENWYRPTNDELEESSSLSITNKRGVNIKPQGLRNEPEAIKEAIRKKVKNLLENIELNETDYTKSILNTTKIYDTSKKDNFSRPIYKDDKNLLYVDVDMNPENPHIHSITHQGEPNSPVENFDIVSQEEVEMWRDLRKLYKLGKENSYGKYQEFLDYTLSQYLKLPTVTTQVLLSSHSEMDFLRNIERRMGILAEQINLNTHTLDPDYFENGSEEMFKPKNQPSIEEVIATFKDQGIYVFKLNDDKAYELMHYLRENNIPYGETSQLGSDITVYDPTKQSQFDR